MVGEGLPVYHESGHGDLFVEYIVVLPSKLTEKTRASKSTLDQFDFASQLLILPFRRSGGSVPAHERAIT